MKIFDLRGIQKRFIFLVAGSLAVLLLFGGLQGIFLAEKFLPADAYENFRPILVDSTWRMIGVGVLYIAVVTLAAMFLTHRAVGPFRRLEDEVEEGLREPKKFSGFQVREDDDMRTFTMKLNELIDKVRKS